MKTTDKASPLVILQPGQKIDLLQSVSGDFSEWILDGMQWPLQNALILKPNLGDPLPPINHVKAVVISGSTSMVTDESIWLMDSIQWIKQVAEFGLPILGICFGHQLLAHAFGGSVDYNPNGVGIGTAKITLTEEGEKDLLLHSLSKDPFVYVSHFQSIQVPPPQAIVLATNTIDPYHAFRIGNHIWGVQFHPEFNQEIAKGFWDEYFIDPRHLSTRGCFPIKEASTSQMVLRNFATYLNKSN